MTQTPTAYALLNLSREHEVPVSTLTLMLEAQRRIQARPQLPVGPVIGDALESFQRLVPDGITQIQVWCRLNTILEDEAEDV